MIEDICYEIWMGIHGQTDRQTTTMYRDHYFHFIRGIFSLAKLLFLSLVFVIARVGFWR